MFKKSILTINEQEKMSGSVRIETVSKKNLLRNLLNTNSHQKDGNEKKSFFFGSQRKQSLQSATISGIKPSTSTISSSSELQINNIKESQIDLLSTKTCGSTICVDDGNSKIFKYNGSVKIKPNSSNFTNTKRKRGSLFNLFSFQKPSVSNSSSLASTPTAKQDKIFNDENDPVSPINNEKMFSSVILPPPPPEFADLTQKHRKHSYSGKSSKNEGTFKQHQRSIFNALKRKSVKSIPSSSIDQDNINDLKDNNLENDQNSNNNNQYNCFQNSNSNIKPEDDIDSTLVFIREIDNNNEIDNKDNNNDSDISDAESTISNLFSFDNYISSSNNKNEEYLKSNNKINSILNYAEECLVEDESCQLTDFNINHDNKNNNVTRIDLSLKKNLRLNSYIWSVDGRYYIYKNKIKRRRASSLPQILSTITKPSISSSSSSSIDQCLISSNSDPNLSNINNHIDNSKTMLSYEQPNFQQKVPNIQKSNTNSINSPLKLSNEQTNQSISSTSLLKGSKHSKIEQDSFRTCIYDSDIENNDDINFQKVSNSTKKPTLEELDVNKNTNQKRKIQTNNNNSTRLKEIKSLNNNNNELNLLKINILDNLNKTFNLIEMVQIKKGLKLRELLHPVLYEHNLNIDNYNIYLIENNYNNNNNNDESNNNDNQNGEQKFIDLNTICDKLVNVELTLKPKPLTNTETLLTEINNELSIETTINLNNIETPSPTSIQTSKQANLSSSSSLNSSPSSPSVLSNIKLQNNNNNNNIIIKQNSLNQVTSSSLPPLSTTPVIPQQIVSNKTIPNNSNNNTNTSNIKNNQKRYSTTVISDEQTIQTSTRYSTSSVSSIQSCTSPTGINSSYKYPKTKGFHSKFPNLFSNNSHIKAMERLAEKLSSYSNELPLLPENIKNLIQNYDESILEIESEWKNAVGENFSKSLSKQVQQQQMAIWELFTTEISHIKLTKVIINLYLNCLYDLKTSEQTRDLFNNIEIEKLLLNIVEIFNCNLKFWQSYLHPHVLNNKMNNFIINPCLFKTAFSQFKTVFAPYDTFCIGHNDATDYLKQKSSENEYFKAFITWAENHPCSERFKLTDLMMLPIQRITRYNLLLDKILGNTINSLQCSEIVEMQQSVKDLLNSFNARVKHLTQFNSIIESIESYEGVVGPTDEVQKILDEYKKFDLRSPMPGCCNTKIREIIHQGPLKLKDSSRSTVDVQGIVFTDMLLIIKERKNKRFKIARPPIPTNRIEIREIKDEKAFVIIQLNGYNVSEAVYMLTTPHYKRWIDCLNEAKTKYKNEIENYQQDLMKEKMKMVNNQNEETFLLNEINQNNIQSITQISENNLVYDSIQNRICITESIDNINKTNVYNNDNEISTIKEDDSVFVCKSDKIESLNKVKNYESNEYCKIDLGMDYGETEVIDDDEVENYDAEIGESTLKTIENTQINNCFENNENFKYDQQQTILISSSTTVSSSSPSSVSPIITHKQQQQQQIKFLQNNSPHSRKLSKYKGRYMTDPLSSQQKDRFLDENSYKIPKRNSLNDRIESQASSSSPTSPNNQQEILINGNTNKNLIKTFYGDSTSTLMSTDSGVSSTTYGVNQSNSIESIVRDYNKLSEEEVDEIFKGFVKSTYSDNETENIITKLPNNENFDRNSNEIERKKFFENYSFKNNNQNEKYEINSNESDETKHENDFKDNSTLSFKTNFDCKTPKWQTSYQDRESVPIPLVAGTNDINNNNIIHKLSPQVYNSFNVTSNDGVSNNSSFAKKFNNKIKFDRNSTIDKSHVIRYDTQNSKFKTNKSHSVAVLSKQSNNNISVSNENKNRISHSPLIQFSSQNVPQENESENVNAENEIQLITSQISSIVRLNPRMSTQNQISKRSATPIDHAYAHQYENNKNNTKNSSLIDNYDSTIKSANNSSLRFNNQQQPHLMFVNLLHTTPDATEV